MDPTGPGQGETVSRTYARAIVRIADLITLPLRPHRRMETKAAAAEYLAAEVPVDTPHGQLLFYTATQRAYHYPWFFQTDEPETLAWIDGFEAGAVLWDIGANIGAFSLYAALRPGVSVVAFEPSASSYAAFTRNIEINRMDGRIAAYCLAFSGRTEINVLNMNQTGAGHSMHGFGTALNAYDEQIDVRFRQAAIGMAIDDFVAWFRPPPPTHIKIDVDGIEADILRGGARLMRSPGIRSVLVEVMGDPATPRNAEILGLMADLGYESLPKRSADDRNIVFRPRATTE